ncbi:MAG: DNA repair exonuclease [Candidatus Bilamarchaeaceae archaeon]
MKLAIISDSHIGYPRFSEDSVKQAGEAFMKAAPCSDAILFAGDLFDTKVPKLEILSSAASIFSGIRTPIYAIHGNHERRGKDAVNPLKLLGQLGLVKYLHGEKADIGSGVSLYALGSVPEEYAKTAIEECMKRWSPESDKGFRILMIHQGIKELVYSGEDDLELSYLESLPFDLIINGHIHKRGEHLKGRLLIPGSTVITQLKKDEQEPKGFTIYDTEKRSHDFVPIDSREFLWEEMEFKGASPLDVERAVSGRIADLRKDKPSALVRIVVKGTLKEGVGMEAVNLPSGIQDVFIDNELGSLALKDKLETIKRLRERKASVRDVGLAKLSELLKGKTSFNVPELFELLAEDEKKAMEYLGLDD